MEAQMSNATKIRQKEQKEQKETKKEGGLSSTIMDQKSTTAQHINPSGHSTKH